MNNVGGSSIVLSIVFVAPFQVPITGLKIILEQARSTFTERGICLIGDLYME